MKPYSILSSVLLCLPLLLSGQTLRWTTDYTGTTTYQVPTGWIITIQQEGEVSTWQAQESPGEKGTPGLLVIAMADPGLELELLTTTLLQEVTQEIQIKNRIASYNQSHLTLGATINGIQAEVATMAMRDQQWVYVAMFASPSDRFYELGGASVLYRALQQQSPYLANERNGSELSNGSNMQDITTQNQILQQGVTHPSHELIGSWLQSFSILSGDDYLTSENAIRTEERGYAHLLDLREDNTYTLTYRYQSYSGGCPYEAEVVETGGYKLYDNTLKLQRDSYEANYNVCGDQSVERNNQLAPASYQIGSTGQELVLRGAPFEYSISVHNDASGQAYIQEGFRRQ
ncbi:MAG: hypothetical protein AAFO02_03860 [Bacteroidota bacterium]